MASQMIGAINTSLLTCLSIQLWDGVMGKMIASLASGMQRTTLAEAETVSLGEANAM